VDLVDEELSVEVDALFDVTSVYAGTASTVVAILLAGHTVCTINKLRYTLKTTRSTCRERFNTT
jgi:hypothetical protein